MGLTDIARNDLQNFTSDLNGWGVNMTFTTPDGSATALVIGLHTKFQFAINGETGQRVNTKTASVSVAEKFLSNQSYPVRVNGEVKMNGHLVSVMDSTGVVCNYIVREQYPDEKLGLLVFILGDLQ